MGQRTERARELRRNSTDAEWKLWGVLRNRQAIGVKWRRQVPIDRYFADFACKDLKLVIELDGDQHAVRAEYDAARTQVIEACGYQVTRFGNLDVLTNLDGVAARIDEIVRIARTCPHPPTRLSPSGPLPLPRPGEVL